MRSEVIQNLQSHFDTLVQTLPEEEIEFWFARDLMDALGYLRWENFVATIRRAIESCQTTGYDPSDHFRSVTKMINLAKGAEREEDIKKLERRVKSEEKRLVEESGKLPK